MTAANQSSYFKENLIMKLPKQSTGIQRAIGGITAKYVLGIVSARFRLTSPLRSRLRDDDNGFPPPPRCFCKPDPTSYLGRSFLEMCADPTRPGDFEPTGRRCEIEFEGSCTCPPPQPTPPCRERVILTTPTTGKTYGGVVQCLPLSHR